MASAAVILLLAQVFKHAYTQQLLPCSHVHLHSLRTAHAHLSNIFFPFPGAEEVIKKTLPLILKVMKAYPKRALLQLGALTWMLAASEFPALIADLKHHVPAEELSRLQTAAFFGDARDESVHQLALVLGMRLTAV